MIRIKRLYAAKSVVLNALENSIKVAKEKNNTKPFSINV
jgi:hypothetical protein